mmetsp:Transcript_18717/g.38724  ORF Transcript_18717/g.38724 Transcript_18717/m.38724 type:complete len:169 (-) Transcript_18717:825-1331(-)
MNVMSGGPATKALQQPMPKKVRAPLGENSAMDLTSLFRAADACLAAPEGPLNEFPNIEWDYDEKDDQGDSCEVSSPQETESKRDMLLSPNSKRRLIREGWGEAMEISEPPAKRSFFGIPRIATCHCLQTLSNESSTPIELEMAGKREPPQRSSSSPGWLEPPRCDVDS